MDTRKDIRNEIEIESGVSAQVKLAPLNERKGPHNGNGILEGLAGGEVVTIIPIPGGALKLKNISNLSAI